MNTYANKVVGDLPELAERIKTVPRPLVFTNGCFDILHRGHVAYLEQAASLGKSLLIAVNSDASIETLNKGPERPINPLDDRMAVLAALQCTDLIVAFDDDTPIELILLSKPDYLIKGGDWPEDKIVGAKEVRQAGGTVRSIPIEYPRSTTDLVRRIRANE